MKSLSLSKRQSGLTLIEMVITLSIVVFIITVSVMSMDQNGQRAENLQAKLQLVRSGVLRFQNDLPCGAATLSALTKREDAAVGLCGNANNLDNWRGPYVDASVLYVNGGDSDLASILPGASLSIQQEVLGSQIFTILKVSEVTSDMRSALVAICGDECTPYKNITGDEETVGIVVSKVVLRQLN